MGQALEKLNCFGTPDVLTGQNVDHDDQWEDEKWDDEKRDDDKWDDEKWETVYCCIALKVKVKRGTKDPDLCRAKILEESDRPTKITTLRGRKVYANAYGREILEAKFKIEDGDMDPKDWPFEPSDRAFTNPEGMKMINGILRSGGRK